LEDIDDLGGVIFYKDQEGHLYCFTLQDIKKVLASGSNINPLSGNEFHNDFLKTIQKLNLVDVSSENEPWHPTNPMEAALFGDDDDDSEWESDDPDKQEPDKQEPDKQEPDKQEPDKQDNGQASYKLVDHGFIDYIEQLIHTMQETGHQFNFESIEADAKEAIKTHYCFSCSKRLTDDTKWATTINMVRKTGEFQQNTYHTKCLYSAPFKI
jgi:hypothetical protein